MQTETYITRGVDAVARDNEQFMAFIQGSYLRFIGRDWGDCYKEDAQLNDSDPMTAMGVYKYPFKLDLPGYVTTDRMDQIRRLQHRDGTKAGNYNPVPRRILNALDYGVLSGRRPPRIDFYGQGVQGYHRTPLNAVLRA